MNENRLNYLMAYLRELRQLPPQICFVSEPAICTVVEAINEELGLNEQGELN